MDLSSTIGLGVILVVIGILFIWRPWEDSGNLDLTSREEKDDSMKTPSHIDPVIKAEVEAIVDKKRRATRKKVVSEEFDACAVSEQDIAVPVVKKRTRAKKQI